MTGPDGKKHIDVAELRKFGLVSAILVLTIFFVLIPLLLDKPRPNWPLVLALILSILALALPASLHGVYRLWLRFGQIAGKINTYVILALLYYLVVTPMAVTIKILGIKLITRKFAPDCNTYRDKVDTQENTHMEKPY